MRYSIASVTPLVVWPVAPLTKGNRPGNETPKVVGGALVGGPFLLAARQRSFVAFVFSGQYALLGTMASTPSKWL